MQFYPPPPLFCLNLDFAPLILKLGILPPQFYVFPDFAPLFQNKEQKNT